VAAVTRYVLTLRCLDGPGIVNAATGALLEAGANIVESAQFGDVDTGLFAMRSVFDAEAALGEVETRLDQVRARLKADITVRPVDRKPKVLIMVSKEDHCLLDLLYRRRNGELAIEVPLVVSNHPACRELAERYDVPYEVVPVAPGTKARAEARLMELVEALDIDLIVLARYMQVLSADVCERMAGRIINIHHSFLPGFKGGRPYHQAHLRGVKLIGATAHYVTADLDEGPIIDQDVEHVTHAHTVEDLIRVGRDIERIVLSRAVRRHSEDRVILIGSKTVVFH